MTSQRDLASRFADALDDTFPFDLIEAPSALDVLDCLASAGLSLVESDAAGSAYTEAVAKGAREPR